MASRKARSEEQSRRRTAIANEYTEEQWEEACDYAACAVNKMLTGRWTSRRESLHELVDEAVQMAACRFLDGLHEFNPHRFKLKAHLSYIACNQCLNKLGERKKDFERFQELEVLHTDYQNFSAHEKIEQPVHVFQAYEIVGLVQRGIESLKNGEDVASIYDAMIVYGLHRGHSKEISAHLGWNSVSRVENAKKRLNVIYLQAKAQTMEAIR